MQTLKSVRIGLGTGMGRGYKNLAPRDSHVHYLAGKGVTIYQPFFKGQRLGHNPLELSLYVPSTQGKSKRILTTEFNKRLGDAEKTMSQLFGGYTKVNAEGGWVDNGKVIQEPVGKVTSFTTVKDFEKGKAEFEQYVEHIRNKYRQASISLEFEGDLFFYEPKEGEVK
jgi:hypothetical protein